MLLSVVLFYAYAIKYQQHKTQEPEFLPRTPREYLLYIFQGYMKPQTAVLLMNK